MCRSLGLHQAASMRGDTPEVRADKMLLFWCAYMLDKGLSLRMGRASLLQDYDISLPQRVERAYAPWPGSEVLTMWVRHSGTQGRIYEKLYSPAALVQGEEARVQSVRSVAAELHALVDETHDLLARLRAAPPSEMPVVYFGILRSDEVSYYSSLALVYRALPAPATANEMGANGSRFFADECIDAARAAMRGHQAIMDILPDTAMKVGHLHW
jgi:hypothetical protein